MAEFTTEECVLQIDKNKPIDVAILEEMAFRCPIGKEVEFVVGLARLGFSGSIPAYREAVLRGFAKRWDSRAKKTK